MSSFNPHFDKVVQMVDNLAKVHAGEIDELELAYQELKNASGDVYQLVPYLRIVYKG